MGEGSPRNTRRLQRPGAPRPAASRPNGQQPAAPGKPAETPRPAVTRMPAALRSAAPERQKSAADLLISRTATLDDPLTTSLLAEVTRARTVEVSPEQIHEAMDEAMDTEPEAGDPDDSI